MARNINAINTTKYLGVNAPTPPNFLKFDRAPTANDAIGIEIGTIWLNTAIDPASSLSVYMLVAKPQNVAEWINFGGAGGSNVEILPDAGTSPVVPNVDHELSFDGGTLIQTVGGLNSVTWNLTQGMDGQIPIAATGLDTAYANITSGDGSVTITNGANTIDLSVVSGTDTVNTLTGDAGGAVVPTANNINVLGGELLNTAGAGSTLTLNFDRGTDGQIPIAATGAPTVYANLTSSNASITITNTANGIDLINNGAGGSSITITTFDASGTWTKGAGTLFVEVYGWSGGGGGGGGANSGGGCGGAGGASGWFRFPGAFVGATSTVTIGAGGIGAPGSTGSLGTNGGNSGQTSFGNIKFVATNVQGSTVNFISGGQGGQGWVTVNSEGSLVQPYLTTNIPWAAANATYTGGDVYRSGQGSSSSAGQPGADTGAQAVSGGTVRIVGNYLQGTSGGGGGGVSRAGGRGGNINCLDTTLINAGGSGGAAGSNGSNGNNAVTGATSDGIMAGGTGGGGGGGYNGVLGGNGGTGGFPGGGGGGGGHTSGVGGGAGGNGGAGRIVVIEFA